MRRVEHGIADACGIRISLVNALAEQAAQQAGVDLLHAALNVEDIEAARWRSVFSLDSGPKRNLKLNHLCLPGEGRVFIRSAKLLCYQFKRDAFQ